MISTGGVETWIGLSVVAAGRWRLCVVCCAVVIFLGAITLGSAVGTPP